MTAMRDIISKAALEARQARYKPGARVELVSMTDPHTDLKPGDRGEVTAVDSIGTVHIQWDSGSSLGAAYGADSIKLLSKADIIKEQAKKVAATGRTNMLDIKPVFEIALEIGCYELADFIFMDTKRYSSLILTGEIEGEVC